MSPWTVVGWCVAVLAVLGTVTVVGFAVGAVCTFVWAFFMGKERS